MDAFGGGGEVDMQLEGIGVSLIDNEPRELIYMCLSSLRLRAHRSRAQQAVQLLLAHLQVDAAVPTAKFPVMLAPLPAGAHLLFLFRFLLLRLLRLVLRILRGRCGRRHG